MPRSPQFLNLTIGGRTMRNPCAKALAMNNSLLATVMMSALLTLLILPAAESQGVPAQPDSQQRSVDWRQYQSPTVPRPNILLRAILFNFTDVERPLGVWEEYSDTSMLGWGGTSKATMKLQRTPQYQRAVFFGMINSPTSPPSTLQPGFASMFTKTNFDLRFFTGIKVRVQVQGVYSQLKMILFDNFGELKLEGKAPPVVFELVRDLPFDGFNEVDFNFADFLPFVNAEPLTGKQSQNTALNLTRITGVGFKITGRPKVIPAGVSSFEIDYMVAYRNVTSWIPTPDSSDTSSATLFDFTETDTATSWYEISDASYMDEGKSCAAMDMLVPNAKNEKQRAVFFGLLNLQDDQSGFAGVQSDVSWDLSKYAKLRVRVRAKGSFENFKLMLFDDKRSGNWSSGFTSFFEAPRNKSWVEKDFPLGDFRQYITNNGYIDKPTLNTNDVRGIAFLMFGGKGCGYVGQKGPTTLEIEWIKAMKN